MLSTSQNTAGKLAQALKEAKLRQADVAVACGVSKQAIQGWLKTGRIDKKHFLALAALTKKPVEWWLSPIDDDAQAPAAIENEENDRLLRELKDWRLHASTRSQKVIDQLCALAQTNALREEDWLLIEQMAQRLGTPPP